MFGDSLSQLATHWNRLARDAKWAVLSAPERKGHRWDDASFWATGHADVTRVLAECRALGLAPSGDALDFGCGVGRLSRALAPHFTRVDGVDISSEMVTLAREHAPANTTFHANPRADLRLFTSARFDFALSLMTLQHMPPQLMRAYLFELGRVLKPSAIAYFQIPKRPRRRLSRVRLKTHVRRAAFRVPGVQTAWLWRKGELPLEMYGLPKAKVLGLLARAGFELIAAIPDEAAGDDWFSLHYIARRR